MSTARVQFIGDHFQHVGCEVTFTVRKTTTTTTPRNKVGRKWKE
jgi:hypothetical protein